MAQKGGGKSKKSGGFMSKLFKGKKTGQAAKPGKASAQQAKKSQKKGSSSKKG